MIQVYGQVSVASKSGGSDSSIEITGFRFDETDGTIGTFTRAQLQAIAWAILELQRTYAMIGEQS